MKKPRTPRAPPRRAVPIHAGPASGSRPVPGFEPTSGSVRPPGPIVIGPPIEIDPTKQERIQRALGAAAPLLLLPLRIEYRVVQVGTPIHVIGGVSGLFRDRHAVTVRRVVQPERSREATRTPNRPLAVDELALNAHPEIWFRWFPEDDFAQRGVAPPSDEETRALAAFNGAIGSRLWYDATDATVVSAWQTLVRTIAPERAVYLLRNGTAAGDPQWANDIGKITSLPAQVSLFAIAPNGTVTALGSGAQISDVRYSPDALQDDGWLTNFDVALSKGMGCRISDAALVQAALAADWIVATGLSASADIASAFSELLADAIANGEFEFLDQDVPTNNSGRTPSSLTDPRADLPAFLARAAQSEVGLLDSSLEQSADLFGEALQVPGAIARTAAGAGDTSLEDARAMLYVVGPVLFDSVAQGVVDWAGLQENEVLDFFAASIAARGSLPPVRFGKNPYGILPVTRVGDVESFALDTPVEARIDGLLKKFLVAARSALLDPTQPPPPVIAPGDPDVANKLGEILKLNAVSRRLDVADTGSDATKALRCPYVAGAGWQPGDYLRALREKPLRDLADPDESDPAAPLLYRLARLSLEKNVVLPVILNTVAVGALSLRTMSPPGTNPAADARRNLLAAASVISIAGGAIITGTATDVTAALQRMAARIAQGLMQLVTVAARPDGAARLETLLMETIDLFQHRIDAWSTGLAYRRIVRRRRAGRAALAGGYYGLLGRLRPASATAATDGYIQAPSPAQAASAALLRSAYLRHGAGPFAIDLSSARLRRAELYLDLLRKGLSLCEALGLAGERQLHEDHRDDLIFPLRQQLPLRNVNDESSLEIRLFDGLAFVNADLTVFASDMRPALAQLQTTLAADLDTLSDLVLAEAVHQRAHGHSGAANAWLQVLSGQPVPGHPAVVRTIRSGHASSHRVAWLLDPAPVGNTPRAIAEPALAALASAALQGFSVASVRVEISTPTAQPAATIVASLAADLGLEPIDLLIGGESEVRVRALNFTLRRWLRDPGLQQTLGVPPHENLVSWLARERPMVVRTDGGDPSTADLIAQAATLRTVVQSARALQPSDLNAAVPPDRRLTDAVVAQLLAESSTVLADRATQLASQISTDNATARSALSAFLAKARNYRNGVDASLDSTELDMRFAAVEAARVPFDQALVAVSRYAEPGALRVFATGEVALAPDDFAPMFSAMLDRLDAKTTRLTDAAQAASAAPADAAAARSVLATLTKALQGALDGAALPILPVIRRQAETSPEADFSSGASVAASLAEWSPLRERVRNARTAASGLTAVRAYEVAEAATTTGDPDGDTRPETEAPRPRYYGTFLATSTFANAAQRYAGFVIDEWAEQRPSRSQTTGVAINYDSPQSEAPNCLLLCEPPTGDETTWSELGAARMVAETISWTRIRALPSQRRLSPGGQLPQINQVPFKPGAGGGTRRVPTVPLIRVIGNIGVLEGALVRADPGAPVGLAATGAREISRFSRTEE